MRDVFIVAAARSAIGKRGKGLAGLMPADLLGAVQSAVLERSMVWDDVTVGARAHLQDCIVADGARIPDGARYERCAIVPAGDLVPAAGERIDGEAA